eukprot:m.243892 g.243892  ORF g.243892 m.243892 type:complete len:256 (-) comp28840_c0_seq1:25-792(-)
MAAGKEIYLLRHGESEYNVKIHKYLADFPEEAADPNYWTRERVYDPMIFDSPLTARGEEQARNIPAQFTHVRPELVITSPLTRALQTSLLAFGKETPLVVLPDMREQRHSSCDFGQNGLTLVNRFSELGPQLADLPEQWWGPGCHIELGAMGFVPHTLRETDEDVCARLHRVVEFLLSRPEQRIVLVGHGVLFYHLTHTWLENCQLIPYQPSSGIASCLCTRCGGAPQNPWVDELLTKRLEQRAVAEQGEGEVAP